MSEKNSNSGGGSGGNSGEINKNGGKQGIDRETNIKRIASLPENHDPVVDTKSLRALGYGDISPYELDYLISKGLVEEYVQDGKIKFRKIQRKGMRNMNIPSQKYSLR